MTIQTTGNALKHYRVTIELHAMTDAPDWLDELAKFFAQEGLANLQYKGWFYQEDQLAAVVTKAQEVADEPESLSKLWDGELPAGQRGVVIRHCPD
jgi:hypothetical protein